MLIDYLNKALPTIWVVKVKYKLTKYMLILLTPQNLTLDKNEKHQYHIAHLQTVTLLHIKPFKVFTDPGKHLVNPSTQENSPFSDAFRQIKDGLRKAMQSLPIISYLTLSIAVQEAQPGRSRSKSRMWSTGSDKELWKMAEDRAENTAVILRTRQ